MRTSAEQPTAPCQPAARRAGQSSPRGPWSCWPSSPMTQRVRARGSARRPAILPRGRRRGARRAGRGAAGRARRGLPSTRPFCSLQRPVSLQRESGAEPAAGAAGLLAVFSQHSYMSIRPAAACEDQSACCGRQPGVRRADRAAACPAHQGFGLERPRHAQPCHGRVRQPQRANAASAGRPHARPPSVQKFGVPVGGGQAVARLAEVVGATFAAMPACCAKGRPLPATRKRPRGLA